MKVFVTAGLGGMSGAQAKAAVICGAICVVAEVNADATRKRHAQGWVMEVAESLDDVVTRVRRARGERKPLSLAYQVLLMLQLLCCVCVCVCVGVCLVCVFMCLG